MSRWVYTFDTKQTKALAEEAGLRDKGKGAFYHPYDPSPDQRRKNTLSHLSACEALSQLLRVDRVRTVSIEGGPGYDLVLGTQKIRIRCVQDFKNRLFVLKDETLDNTDVLVRAIVPNGAVYFGGWMWVADFAAVANEELFLKSGLLARVVENFHLQPMDTLEHDLIEMS